MVHIPTINRILDWCYRELLIPEQAIRFFEDVDPIYAYSEGDTIFINASKRSLYDDKVLVEVVLQQCRYRWQDMVGFRTDDSLPFFIRPEELDVRDYINMETDRCLAEL